MTMNKTAAVIGGGVIGGGWVGRLLLMGWDVNVYDPDPEAVSKVNAVLENARRALPGLYEHRLPDEGNLYFARSVQAAVDNAQWVSECVPERLEFKLKVLAEIQSACTPDAIITSSTSGFRPSQLQQGSDRPEQIIVAHPFNPVYLVPLVELVGEVKTVMRAKQILSDLGMFPLHVRKEIDAHIADRLLEAVWREGLWLVQDGIATTQEIDDAIRYGFGLRWAQMGMFETYRVAGGEAGMAHFIEQFGPALQWPWTKLMDVPELTDELIQTIAEQSDAQSGQHSIRELERIRDNNLVSILRGLKTQNWAAGELLNNMDKTLASLPDLHTAKLLKTIERVIPVDWTDYNKHMNDSRYAQVFSDAADSVMQIIGADADYINSGSSYFTLDTRIQYLQECTAGDAISVMSEVRTGEGKKLELHHQMHHRDGRLLASAEQLLIHVDLQSRKSSLPSAEVAANLSLIAAAHADLPRSKA